MGCFFALNCQAGGREEQFALGSCGELRGMLVLACVCVCVGIRVEYVCVRMLRLYEGGALFHSDS